MHNTVSLTDFILQEELRVKSATGHFTILLTLIENAAKIISSHVTKSGLVDIIGKTGTTNVFSEEVQKLDEFANTLLVETLLESGCVFAIGSEELEKPIFASRKKAGDYIVFFDPLDGSSNIDTNAPIGTIFSIYHKKDGLLQKGSNQVAAGYIIYGSSTMFVYASQKGVQGFTLDPAIGSFLLSHKDMKMPEKGSIYSVNEANALLYDEKTKSFLESLKKQGGYKARYVGSFVADMHRTLLKGGIFLYPQDKKHPNGKLRLMYEVNPFAFIVEKAGGKTISNGQNPLDITPSDIHQQIPIVLGSTQNVVEYMTYERTF